MAGTHSVVLEHLAASGWFAKHGEVALTGSLAFCLQKDKAAARALIGFLSERVSSRLSAPGLWQAENVDEDSGRHDIVGWVESDEGQAPVVIVEAKLDAKFAANQVGGYVASQQRRLTSCNKKFGVFIVLVPDGRVRSATAEIAGDLAALGATRSNAGWLVSGPCEIAVVVLSWRQVLETMRSRAVSARDDINQLLGACRALRGIDIDALTQADLDGHWRNRIDDLRLIVDRVTREATARVGIRPLPLQTKAKEGFLAGYRYIGQGAIPHIAVGIRDGDFREPLWARWHRTTGDLRAVAERLKRNSYEPNMSGGHLWLPLTIEPSLGAASSQIEDLSSEVALLFTIAAEWPTMP